MNKEKLDKLLSSPRLGTPQKEELEQLIHKVEFERQLRQEGLITLGEDSHSGNNELRRKREKSQPRATYWEHIIGRG